MNLFIGGCKLGVESNMIDSGDTAFIIVCTALVMLMTPAVGLFYGGMVRKKSIISMITLAFVAFIVVAIQWVLFGYSLAFGSDIAGFIGGTDYLFMNGVGLDGDGIPDILFMVFQLVFAGLTVAILTSGFAERIKLGAFVLFALLWTTLVYDPLAHWAWGGGWASQLGALDFAGGTVVHISSGFGALVAAIVIGRRLGFGKETMKPANIPLTLIGGALLWFGWYGFNAGSELAADGIAANAFVVTTIAAAAGSLAWMALSWWHSRPSSLGMISGAVAGLVAITPGAGFVGPMAAIVIGAVAGCVCYGALLFRVKKGLDESLDAWAVHGVGGFFGALATGIFCSAAINGVDGLIYGNVNQFVIQAVDACAAVVYAMVVTYVIAIVIDKTIGLRVPEGEEYIGLDISQHGETTQM